MQIQDCKPFLQRQVVEKFKKQINILQIQNKQVILEYDQDFNCSLFQKSGNMMQKVVLKHNQENILRQQMKRFNFQKIEIKSIRNKITQILQSNNQIKSQRLFGGGCGTSKQLGNAQKKQIEQQQDELECQVLDQQFIENYNKIQDQREIIQNILENKQLESQFQLFKECIFDFTFIIVSNINLYKPQVFQLFETYLAYFITQSKNQESSESDIHQQTELGKMISEFKNNLEQKANNSSCEDVLFMVDILEQYNNQQILDQGKCEFPDLDFVEDVKSFVIKKIGLEINDQQLQIKFDHIQIDELIQRINNKIHSFEDQPKGCILKYLLQVWILKIQKYKEKMWDISNAEEFILYVELFNQMTTSVSNKIIINLIKINQILHRVKSDFQFIQNQKQFINQFFEKIKPFQNQLNIFFKNLNLINQNNLNKEYTLLALQNSCFKQLNAIIQLRLKQMLDQTTLQITDTNQLLVGLVSQYLYENSPLETQEQTKQSSQIIVKQVFESCFYFMELYSQSIKDQTFINKIILFDEQRKKFISTFFENVDQLELKMDNVEEIKRLILLNSITKWQNDLKIQLKQKQKQITQKLSKFYQIYAEQQIEQKEGVNFLKDIQPVNTITLSSIQQILNGFLNFAKDQSILIVSGESGFGKTRLLNEINSILINNLNMKSVYQKYPSYIPIYIQFEELKRSNFNLDQYLLNTSFNQEQLSFLQKSQSFKLFILDNFEECMRAFQGSNQILNITLWKNTKWLLSIRKDKLSEYNIINILQSRCSTAKIGLVELKKLKSQSSLDYLNQVIQLLSSNESEIHLKNNKQQILENLNLRRLIKIPLNLFYISKLLIKKNVSFDNIRFQTDIFELFYQTQFEKYSLKFLNQEIHQQISTRKEKNIEQIIANSFFEYYQQFALQIYLSKEYSSLEIEKNKFKFQFNESIKKHINCNSRDKLYQYIEKFNKKFILIQTELYSFKHLCQFHYFVARAIRHDFQSYESIYKLPISQLKEFIINKKLFVNHKLNNNLDQGLMQTFFHLIQQEIIQNQFMSSCESDNIADLNKYLQYIKMSKIKKGTDISEIDIGSSNLLSVLYMSNFSYFNLNLSSCSFSSAYIPQIKHPSINLDRSNLSQAYIKGSNLNLTTSNTIQSYKNNLPKIFDTTNFFSFNGMCFQDSNLIYSVSESGFLNQFEKINQQYQLKQSKFITSSPLNKLLARKSNLLTFSQNVLFVIDKINLEVLNIFRFSQNIQDFSLINNKIQSCIVVLINNQTFIGDLSTKFNLQDVKIQNFTVCSNNKFLAASIQEQIQIYNFENQLNLIQKIEDQHFDRIVSLSFSSNSKYLASGSLDLSCKIWDVENNFELITSIEDCTSKIIQVTFSNDNKYLFVLSFDKYCRIYSQQDNFKSVSNILVNMKHNALISLSSDDKSFAICSDDNACHIYSNDQTFSLLNIIECNSNQLNSLKFSSNSKFMITYSSGFSRLWNVENNFKIQMKVPEIQQAVIHQFSQDSTYLATAFENKSLKIYNTDKFSCLKTFGSVDDIVDIQFSFNNKFLSIQQKQDKISIYNIQKNFELFCSINEGLDQLQRQYFSHNNQYLILLNGKYNFKLFELQEEFKQKTSFEVDSAEDVITSYDNYYIAFSKNNICKIFSIDQEIKQLCSLQEHQNSICLMQFSKDKCFFSTVSLDNQIIIWNVEQNFSILYKFRNNSQSQLISLQFSHDSNYLITLSKDQTCTFWDIDKGCSILIKLSLDINQLNLSIDFSSDKKYLALAGKNVVSYSLQGVQSHLINKYSENYKGHAHTITSVCYSSDSGYLATASWDKTFKIYDIKQGFQLVKTVQKHSDPINCVNFSRDTKFLVSASVDKTCNIWDTKDNFKLKATLITQDSINSAMFSFDGKYLVLSCWDDTIRVYDVLNEFSLLKEIQNHSKQVNSAQFSSDGKYLVSASDDKTIKIYDLTKDFTLIYNINAHSKAVTYTSFSKNNTDLASVSKDYTCKIWDAQNKFQLKTLLKGHKEQINQCVYSPDDSFLLTCSWDNTCRIWSKSQNYLLLNIIKAHEYPITSLTFSPDQQYLITSSVDNRAKIWPTNKALKILQLVSSLGDLTKAVGCFSQNKKYLLIKLINQDWYIISNVNGNVIEKGKQNVGQQNLQNYLLDQIQLEEFEILQLFDYSFQI